MKSNSSHILRPDRLRRIATSATAARCGGVQSLDMIPPLGLVRPLDAAVVGEKAVDLALHIRRLSPNSTTASVHANLILQFIEQDAGAVIVRGQVSADFIRLVDCIDGCLHIPEMLN